MRMEKIFIADGLYLVRIPEINLRIQCGCPADSVKHLMKRGLIHEKETEGVRYESGPNAVLLSDILVQNGSFSNLAEFPVLQMLYRQGMILPGHPNNDGTKPMLIGAPRQVKAQMEYIYRGNYGLISRKEIMAAGEDEKTAAQLMRMKLRFAFGRIAPAEELLDTRLVEDREVEIRDGLFIRRLKLNVFSLRYRDDHLTVDLNLEWNQAYRPPYVLGFHQIRREYFAVIHSGEGDGWNINHPCMSSILMFQGKIYLIDAGPNVLHSLISLGIGVNEVEGIFHTHAHDDHIGGFTMLMRADRRIKYFATPLVRVSVARKLGALMSISEEDLFDYFEVHDLVQGEWNNIRGMEVKPVYSPHPVETTVLVFRTLWSDGHRTYAHFADIVALDVLDKMVTADPDEAGVSREYFEQVRDFYLEPANIKKLDVGGGLIHGSARDFRNDTSDKILLSHVSGDLDMDQREIGSGAPFGMVDIMIPATENYLRLAAREFLRTYFPSTPEYALNILLNNEILTFNPHTILVKDGSLPDDILLILTGNMERIHGPGDGRNLLRSHCFPALGADRSSDPCFQSTLSAGALIGDIAVLKKTPVMGTYRTANFVQALRLPCPLYLEFVRQNRLVDEIERLHSRRDFLQKTWLFGEVVTYPRQNRLAKVMESVEIEAGEPLFRPREDIWLVEEGRLEKRREGRLLECLSRYAFWGEESVLFEKREDCDIISVSKSRLFRIPGNMVRDIPVVRWKLFESYRRRMETASTLTSASAA